MFSYFLRRFLWAIPTLLLISLLVFGLTKCAADDPVLKLYEISSAENLDWNQQANFYKEKAALLGLDKPLFYGTLRPVAYPAKYDSIFPPERRAWFDDLLSQSGKTELVFTYAADLEAVSNIFLVDSLSEKRVAGAALRRLLLLSDLSQAKVQIERISSEFLDKKPQLDPLLSQIEALQSQTDWRKLYTPKFTWHGMDNQYHHWILGMMRGNWGKSYPHKIEVWTMLKPRIYRTLILNGISLLLAILLSIPLGLWLAKRKDTKTDSRFQALLIGLHAIPAFWLGSILVLAFATPFFGLSFFDYGCSSLSASGSLLAWLVQNSKCLILPISCQTLLAIAVLALQMRASAVSIAQLDFVRTARAKGLPESIVWRKHILPNALFPMITLFSGVLPVLFSGSIVIEYMFDVPGMGTATYDAFLYHDHPVLFAIIMVTAVLTVFGTLLADLLYAWADPRVRF